MGRRAKEYFLQQQPTQQQLRPSQQKARGAGECHIYREPVLSSRSIRESNQRDHQVCNQKASWRGTPRVWNAQRQTTQHVAVYQAQTREEPGWDIIGGQRRVWDPSNGVEREGKYSDQEEEECERGKPELYAILTDKSSLAIHSKLKITTGHKQVEAGQYGISLLAMINNIMCGVEESLQKTTAILMSEKALHTFWENPNVANGDHNSQFDTYVSVL